MDRVVDIRTVRHQARMRGILRYSHDNAYRTTKTTLLLKVTAHISNQNCGMVDLTGEESNLLFQVLEEWERHLAHLDLDGLERAHDEYQK